MTVKISNEQAYAYAELLEILSYTDSVLVQKIPKKLMNTFQTYALSNYEKHIDIQIPLEEQNISQKTAALIALLSLNYWCESDEEKATLKSLLLENEKIKQQELREKYNPDNIFNNSMSNIENQPEHPLELDNLNQSNNNSANLPLDYANLPWYKKVFTTLKNFFFKIFKKQKNPT